MVITWNFTRTWIYFQHLPSVFGYINMEPSETSMYGLQTAPSPRRTNCKIQRNIKYKEDNFWGGEILDENLNWNSHNNSHPHPHPYPYPYPYPHPHPDPYPYPYPHHYPRLATPPRLCRIDKWQLSANILKVRIWSGTIYVPIHEVPTAPNLLIPKLPGITLHRTYYSTTEKVLYRMVQDDG